MKKEEISEKIKSLASQEFKKPIEEIALKANFVIDLGVDSLTIVELLMSIEENFKLTIPDSDNENLNTLEDIINYTTKALNIEK